MKDSKPIPQIKFYKDAVPDILSGRKTLEPRPRSLGWIERIKTCKIVNLTYGPRLGSPIIFAAAEIVNVELRPFSTASRKDLRAIGLGWQDRPVAEFVAEYERWFSRELQKGYPVAWVHFKVKDNGKSEIYVQI